MVQTWLWVYNVGKMAVMRCALPQPRLAIHSYSQTAWTCWHMSHTFYLA